MHCRRGCMNNQLPPQQWPNFSCNYIAAMLPGPAGSCLVCWHNKCLYPLKELLHLLLKRLTQFLKTFNVLVKIPQPLFRPNLYSSVHSCQLLRVELASQFLFHLPLQRSASLFDICHGLQLYATHFSLRVKVIWSKYGCR